MLVLQHFLWNLDHQPSKPLSRHLIIPSSHRCSLRREKHHTKDSDRKSRSAVRAALFNKDGSFLCLLPMKFSFHYDMLLLLWWLAFLWERSSLSLSQFLWNRKATISHINAAKHDVLILLAYHLLRRLELIGISVSFQITCIAGVLHPPPHCWAPEQQWRLSPTLLTSQVDNTVTATVSKQHL